MTRPIFVAASMALCGALVGCEDFPDGLESLENHEEPAVEESYLEQAREAGAETYAPGLYARAEERNEDRLARLATSEAFRVREEARRAADEKIREAAVLLEVVEKIASHQTPEGASVPDEAELSGLRADLARAERAFARGDFPEAGLLAQGVTFALREPRT